jgi:hypothetical protein
MAVTPVTYQFDESSNRLTVSHQSANVQLDLGVGQNDEVSVLSVIKSDFADFPRDFDGAWGLPQENSTEVFTAVFFKYKPSWNDSGADQYAIRLYGDQRLTSVVNGQDGASFLYSDKSVDFRGPLSLIEPFLDIDLNGDDLKDGTTRKTNVSTDTEGVALQRNVDGVLYVVDDALDAPFSEPMAIMPRWGSGFNLENSSSTTTSVAVAVERVQKEGEPEYILAVKQSSMGPSGKLDDIQWQVYTLRTAKGWEEFEKADGMSYATPPGSMTGAQQSNEPELYFSSTAGQPQSSIAEYEQQFGQNLDDDPTIGVPLSGLVAADGKTSGVRLEKDPKTNALFIVNEVNGQKEAKGIGNLSSITWDNASQVVSVYAVRDENEAITAYKLAVKKTYDSASNAPPMAGPSQDTATSGPVTYWDVLHLDAEKPEINWGRMVNGNWVDDNVRNLKSIAAYELDFGEDLDKDGKTGIAVADLARVSTDTAGEYLARGKNNALFIVEGEGSSARIKSVKADYLEQESGTWKREAIAVEAIRNDDDVITGYRLLMKNGTGVDVNYDINRLDAGGKLVWGANDANGQWVNFGDYGITSLAAYEERFGQDLNGDGKFGVDVASLTVASTDTAGVKLARDAAGGLFIVSGEGATATAKVIGGASGIEWQSNSTGDTSVGGYSRKAVAVEAVTANGATTGYKVAVKNTDSWSGAERVTWEVINLNADAKVQWGAPTGMGGEIKSIAPYEQDFLQDLNGDNRIGIDTSNLVVAETDTAGVRLARDAEGALYIISGSGTAATAKAITGGWGSLEYENNWGNGYNIRKAVAVEEITEQGQLTGYKLAVENRNAWDGQATEQKNFDIYQLSTSGVIETGRMSGGVWTDRTIWGVKSLVPYEVTFGQDFNNDNIVGIDANSLTLVATDKLGVRLRRDREGSLYLIDEAPGSSPKALGNAGWLEYSNDWGSGSNSREAIAIGSTTSNGQVTGYKLAMKNVNSYDGRSETNWEILTLDADANISWAAGPAGGSIWTPNIRPFESLVGDDLDGDGQVGIPRTSLTVVDTDSNADGVTLARDADGMIYILDGASTTLALTDSYGGTPALEFSRSWEGGSSSAEIFASSKESGGDYKIAVKVTKQIGANTNVAWQIHTVSSEGVLDWSAMATVRNPARFESIFGQDLNGDGVTGQNIASLQDVATDVGFNNSNAVKLQKDASGGLYIFDADVAANNNLTFVVDARGGSPSFDVSFGSFKSEVFAVNKRPDGSYRVAVKKTTTSNDTELVKWDVHYLSARNAQTNEAVIDLSKFFSPRDVRDVERAIFQDLDADGQVGVPETPPVNITGDSGSIIAAENEAGRLFIRDGQTLVQVIDAFGQGVVLSTSDTWDAGDSSFVAQVVAAGQDATTSVYKVAVKETLTLATEVQSVLWKIYSVAADGTLTPTPVVTKSLSLWETSFFESQDVDGITPTPQALAIDSDVGYDEGSGATYVFGQQQFLVVTDGEGGVPSFVFTEAGGEGTEAYTVVSEVVGAAEETTDDRGTMLMAVQSTITVGETASRSWTVHTLNLNDAGTANDPTDDYYDIDWTAAVVTTDMTDYVATFGTLFSQPEVATVGA